ncbi:steroid 17-alpha-hydroxylase/17,20 lyase-like [Liolophura sinensis]|uniref:steroid 17-alpha-hydroxylase/17,20 lyase-like n=1 Tax=Liolophura sinensis TaxID=3198878 RepID=UPI00315829E9
MALFIAIIVLATTLLLIYYFTKPKRTYSYPPGPKGLPIIGSVLDVSPTHLHVSLTEFGKTYGDLFSVNLLGNRVVVLNSVEVIREAFFTEEYGAVFAGRPFSFLGKYTDNNCSSFSFMSTCKIWQRLRKIVYKTINMYGDGVQEAENNILEELHNVIQWIEERSKTPIDVADVIVPSISNIMTYLLIGRRFDYESPELKSAVHMSIGINDMGTAGIDALMTMMPFLRFFPFGYGALYKRYMAGIQQYLQYYHHAQKASHDPCITRGLIDVLLKTQEELRAKGDYCPISDENVTSTMKDTIEAGTLTTRASLISFFLVIGHKPEVVKRIQGEIRREIGGRSSSVLEGSARNARTQKATVLEIVRFVTPNSSRPATLHHVGNHVQRLSSPKRYTVLPNYWGVNHSERYWKNPNDFIPERFLDDSGKLLPLEHPNDASNLMSFSIGKRSCPGENFAKSRIFLFITSLLQRFNFSASEDHPLPPLDSRFFNHGIVPCPRAFQTTCRGPILGKPHRILYNTI